MQSAGNGLKRGLFVAAAGFVVLTCLEVLAFFAYCLLPRDLYYQPPQDKDLVAYQVLTRKRNFSGTLGWLPPFDLLTESGYRRASGTEWLPKFASVYGDSFAFGSDVSDDEAWTAVLSRRLGKRVENYGVPFYGTGQALQRFLENTWDIPEIAVLVIMSENIVRNVNQNCDFIYGSGLMFRPVWSLNEKDIRLNPVPQITGMGAAQYLAMEKQLLQHEYFWPDTAAGVKHQIHFPYLFFVPRALLGNRRFMSGLYDELGLHPEPWYEEFYDPQHISGAYELTLRMCEKFVREAKARGVERPIILFLPRDRDIRYFRATGRWGYEEFWKEARRRCPEFYTLADNIAQDFSGQADRMVMEYFHTARWAGAGHEIRERGGHYAAKGNAYLADVMFRIVNQRIF